MGLTERHLFENEDMPENYEWALEDAVYNSRRKGVKPICKLMFNVPYYFCGDCKAMLNMYATKAKFCSRCGQAVLWE